jgi:hypothetical protein
MTIAELIAQQEVQIATRNTVLYQWVVQLGNELAARGTPVDVQTFQPDATPYGIGALSFLITIPKIGPAPFYMPYTTYQTWVEQDNLTVKQAADQLVFTLKSYNPA